MEVWYLIVNLQGFFIIFRGFFEPILVGQDHAKVHTRPKVSFIEGRRFSIGTLRFFKISLFFVADPQVEIGLRVAWINRDSLSIREDLFLSRIPAATTTICQT